MYSCGNPIVQPRIVGGHPAVRQSFPWQAALVTSGNNVPFCGATILSTRLVVTAAHCV